MKAKSLLSAVLALMLIMPSTALADQSTTQGKTAYKDLNARTEVYAVTQTPGSDYPYYGAKWEPKGGVYYGRTDHGGQVGSGYGLANEAALENESIVSHYYGTNDMTSSYDLQYSKAWRGGSTPRVSVFSYTERPLMTESTDSLYI